MFPKHTVPAVTTITDDVLAQAKRKVIASHHAYRNAQLDEIVTFREMLADLEKNLQAATAAGDSMNVLDNKQRIHLMNCLIRAYLEKISLQDNQLLEDLLKY